MDSWDGKLAKLDFLLMWLEKGIQLYFGTSVWSVGDAGVTQPIFAAFPNVTAVTML